MEFTTLLFSVNVIMSKVQITNMALGYFCDVLWNRCDYCGPSIIHVTVESIAKGSITVMTLFNLTGGTRDKIVQEMGLTIFELIRNFCISISSY